MLLQHRLSAATNLLPLQDINSTVVRFSVALLYSYVSSLFFIMSLVSI